MENSNHPILAAITYAETHYSGEWKNRTISHLKNAYAAAMIAEGQATPMHQPHDVKLQGGCICPPGAVDTECPVHGNSR